jgi:pumilio homology domain family member 6
MGGIKRKEAPNGVVKDGKKQKVVESKSKKSRLDQAAEEDEFAGFEDEEEALKPKANGKAGGNHNGPKQFKLDTSSAEAHAKQRALAKERKAGKPNADLIARSKQLWEKLRRKSHVAKDERKQLVDELFTIINGRVRDFVFKHDSVRVIQCALKYANQEQRRMIVDELKEDIRPLVESKYGKFLVAKMVVEGNQEIRDIIIPQFYGHVKRLINHPEASWILDDIYRQIATTRQKAVMLREWYGTEFALVNRKLDDGKVTADLNEILEWNPEKRSPILTFCLQMINSLIQKKMTGFTMLHDAMLQYFLALKSGSEEHSEFLEILRGDIETKVEAEAANSTGGGDLFRNLAFTKSGSRLVCLALAWGTAKDRKVITKCFKDTVDLMSWDQYAKMVLVVGLDVADDTKMTGKAVYHELLGQNIEDETQRLDRLEQVVANVVARVPALYMLAGPAKWLMNAQDRAVLNEVHEIRSKTSKKAPEIRRKELLAHLAPPLLKFVTQRAENLVQSSFGCQCIVEVLLEANADQATQQKEEAKTSVAQLAAGDPTEEGHIAHNPAAGRMLKTLVLGGNFDAETKTTKLAEPHLGFAEALFPVIEPQLVQWACSASPFVVVALLESEDVSEEIKKKVKAALKKGKKEIEKAAKGEGKKAKAVDEDGDDSKSKKRKVEGGGGSAGAKLLLEKIGEK